MDREFAEIEDALQFFSQNAIFVYGDSVFLNFKRFFSQNTFLCMVRAYHILSVIVSPFVLLFDEIVPHRPNQYQKIYREGKF